MVEKTLGVERDVVKIYTDMIFNPFSKCHAECIIEYSNNIEEISSGDAYITRNSAFWAKDPALHFTKVLVESDGPYWGSEIFAGVDKIQGIDTYSKLLNPPLFIPIMEMKETEQTLLQKIDWDLKEKMIAVVPNPLACSLQSVQDLYDTLKSLYQTLLYCNQKNDLDFTKLKAIVLIDPFDDKKWFQSLFWKSIARGTFVFYYNVHSMENYALKVSQKMSDISFSLGFRWKLSSILYHSNLKAAFDFKQKPLSQAMKSVLNHTLEDLPCHVCQNVKKRKQATLAMLDLFNQQTPATVEMHQIPNSAGPLLDLDAIFIPHYRKATGRLAFMTRLFERWHTNTQFITAFDREDLSDQLISQVLYDENEIRNTKTPLKEIKKGEISLALKNYWAYYWLLKENKKQILLIEDDATNHPDASCGTLKTFLELLPSNYAIAHIGACNTYHRQSIFGSPYGVIYEGVRYVFPNLENHDHCTTSYLISKQGALLMFKSLPLLGAIDYQVVGGGKRGGMFHPDFSVYSTWPPIFIPSLLMNLKGNTGIRD